MIEFYQWYEWQVTPAANIRSMIIPIQRSPVGYMGFAIPDGVRVDASWSSKNINRKISDFQPNSKQKHEMIQILFEELS
jgi:hypothetical protein